MQIRVARIYSTFGPRMHMDDGRVVSNLILQALRNEPITVMSAVWIWFGCMKCIDDANGSGIVW